MPRTIIEKIWDAHVVKEVPGAPTLLYIDLHLVHEVTSPQAFEGLRRRGLRVRRPDRTLATADHNVPTVEPRVPIPDPVSAQQVRQLEANCREFGVPCYSLDSERQGIVHVIGPELGLTQPGMTIVCGDSHTATHGALGALAFGIGTSEVETVLATQCLLQRKPMTYEVRVEGRLRPGVSAKDIILALIAKIGTGGGTGCVFEYTGSAIRSLSMEERLTVCNMSIEAGARAGLVAPDDVTFQYLAGRPFAPKGAAWEAAVERWRQLPTDEGARYDRSVTLDADALEPMITFGTNPGLGIPITAPVPEPLEAPPTQVERDRRWSKALAYMALEPGKPLTGPPCQCRLHRELHELAHDGPARRGVAPQGTQGQPERARAGGARLQQIKRQAEAEGLDHASSAGGRRVARGGLLDVHCDERRPAGARPVRGIDLEPQLRGPPGQGRPHVSRQPADGSRQRRHRRGDRPPHAARLNRRICRHGKIHCIRVLGGRAAGGQHRHGPDHSGALSEDCFQGGARRQLFYDWRYDADGNPRPDFVLNRPPGNRAQVLLAGDNFGCGSSREHAPWALVQFGFKAVISTSFADIFKGNALKNGLLPIVIPPEAHARLLRMLEADPLGTVRVDLASQTLTLPDGTQVAFPVDPFARTCMLEGIDELGFLLKHEAEITAWEQSHPAPVDTLSVNLDEN
jgi:3-isopropylmalate/(R)-2-methylmalate dehydratase large subunit